MVYYGHPDKHIFCSLSLCYCLPYSKMINEFTDTQNVIFRILVPFSGRLLKTVTACSCERVSLTCWLTDITVHFLIFLFQPCKFFQPSRQETPLVLNGLTGLWFRIHVFSTHLLSLNVSQWNISSLASARCFDVVPRSEHEKSRLENH